MLFPCVCVCVCVPKNHKVVEYGKSPQFSTKQLPQRCRTTQGLTQTNSTNTTTKTWHNVTRHFMQQNRHDQIRRDIAKTRLFTLIDNTATVSPPPGIPVPTWRDGHSSQSSGHLSDGAYNSTRIFATPTSGPILHEHSSEIPTYPYESLPAQLLDLPRHLAIH